MLENTFWLIASQTKILTKKNMIEPTTSHPFSPRTNITTYSPLHYLLSNSSMRSNTDSIIHDMISSDLKKSQFILPSTKAISSLRIINWRHINGACFRSNDIFDNWGSLCLLCPYSFLSSHPLLFNSTNFDTPVLQSLFLSSACLISNKIPNCFTVFDKLTSIKGRRRVWLVKTAQ